MLREPGVELCPCCSRWVVGKDDGCWALKKASLEVAVLKSAWSEIQLLSSCSSPTSGAFLMRRLEVAAQTCFAFFLRAHFSWFFNNNSGAVWPLCSVPPWVREKMPCLLSWEAVILLIFSWQNSRLTERNHRNHGVTHSMGWASQPHNKIQDH